MAELHQRPPNRGLLWGGIKSRQSRSLTGRPTCKVGTRAQVVVRNWNDWDWCGWNAQDELFDELQSLGMRVRGNVGLNSIDVNKTIDWCDFQHRNWLRFTQETVDIDKNYDDDQGRCRENPIYEHLMLFMALISAISPQNWVRFLLNSKVLVFLILNNYKESPRFLQFRNRCSSRITSTPPRMCVTLAGARK